MPARPAHEIAEGARAARLDRGDISVHNSLRRMPIASFRARLVEVVGQIGAEIPSTNSPE